MYVVVYVVAIRSVYLLSKVCLKGLDGCLRGSSIIQAAEATAQSEGFGPECGHLVGGLMLWSMSRPNVHNSESVNESKGP